MLLELSPKQKEFILNSNNLINIAEGAIRGGKTYIQKFLFVEQVLNYPGNYIILGKTSETTKRNIIEDPQTGLRAIVPYNTYNKQRGIFQIGASTCYILGGDSVTSEGKIRGGTFRGALVDELTLLPEDLVDHLVGQCSESNSHIFAACNPDSPYHWVHERYINNNDLVYSLHFDIEDNPSLTSTYINNVKKLFSGLFYDRFILGKWVMAEGIVYQSFEPKKNTYSKLPSKIKIKMRIVAIDYGTGAPCVFLYLLIDEDDNIWEEDEYYYDSSLTGIPKTDVEYVRDFQNFVTGKKVDYVIVDPSAMSFRMALYNNGRCVNLLNANNDVLNGIRTVDALYSERKLKINRHNCPHSLKENTLYAWNKKAQLIGKDEPIKAHDHVKDAERYGVYTYKMGLRVIRTQSVKTKSALGLR